jgi:hypothetical protein
MQRCETPSFDKRVRVFEFDIYAAGGLKVFASEQRQLSGTLCWEAVAIGSSARPYSPAQEC